MPKLSLYIYMGSPQCRAALQTAKMLGLNPTIFEVDMMKGYHKSEEFAKINPEQTLPALIDGSHRVSKSREIMKYLCDAYGGNVCSGKKPAIYPKIERERQVINRILQYDEENVSSVVHRYVVAINEGKDQRILERLEDDLKAILNDFECRLAGQKYVAGDHATIADISLRLSLDMLLTIHYDLEAYGNLRAWISRANEVPFFSVVDGMFKEWMVEKETTPRRYCRC